MLISGDFVVRWLELLGGFSVLLQCLEYARITSSTEPNGVWAWSVQRADIPAQPAWLKHSLDWLYQPTLYQLQLLVRAMAAVALMAPTCFLPWPTCSPQARSVRVKSRCQ